MTASPRSVLVADKEFLEFVEGRELFSPQELSRLFRLAGDTKSADAFGRLTGGVVHCTSEEVSKLIDRAIAQMPE